MSFAGSIGLPGAPVTIRARQGIGDVRASAIYGTLEANFNSGGGNIQRVETNGGPFNGTMIGAGLATGVSDARIRIAGDFTGTMAIAGAVGIPIDITGTLTAGSTIRIGGSLFASAPITVGSPGVPGLAGQIIIGANGPGFGDWLGAVRVQGPTGATLSPLPGYAQTSAAIGGGAVGLSAYRLHGTDCNPAHLAVVNANAAPYDAFVRHYGPLTVAPGLPGDPPVIVERRPFSGGAWTNISSDFVVVADPQGPRGYVVRRADGLRFQGGFEYRITPEPGNVRCSGVAGLPDVTPYQYQFAVRSIFDLNSSNAVEGGDVPPWFDEPVDFTEDGSADATDLLLLLEAVARGG